MVRRVVDKTSVDERDYWSSRQIRPRLASLRVVERPRRAGSIRQRAVVCSGGDGVSELRRRGPGSIPLLPMVCGPPAAKARRVLRWRRRRCAQGAPGLALRAGAARPLQRLGRDRDCPSGGLARRGRGSASGGVPRPRTRTEAASARRAPGARAPLTRVSVAGDEEDPGAVGLDAGPPAEVAGSRHEQRVEVAERRQERPLVRGEVAGVGDVVGEGPHVDAV